MQATTSCSSLALLFATPALTDAALSCKRLTARVGGGLVSGSSAYKAVQFDANLR